MKQFEKMGWIRQGFLGLIVCAVMSPSHAMSVRERYLLQHPQAAAQQEALPAKAVKHAHKQRVVKQTVKKEATVHQKNTHHRHAKAEQPVAKHIRGQQVKSQHQHVTMPKHSKSKFDQQQAHDAAAALNHRKVKHAAAKPVAQASRHQHYVAKEPVKHLRHTATKKHHRHH